MANFNSHVLHAREVDPFKLALFRIIGRIDAQRRNIPLVIASTEDWAWFQLIMVCSANYLRKTIFKDGDLD
jgi:nuclear pore complex protein Nup93